MPFLDSLEKLINEHGSAAIRGEMIAKLRLEAELDAKKLADVTTERNRLLLENEQLKNQVETLSIPPDFIKHKSVLWLKDESGQYEDTPYCPKCKNIMHVLFPNDPHYWSCTPCQLQTPYSERPDTPE
jgi:ABC-type phosphate transport system auxiliary subunit